MNIMKAVLPENVPVASGKCENYNSGILGLIAVVVNGEIGSKPELLDIYAMKLVSNVSDDDGHYYVLSMWFWFVKFELVMFGYSREHL
jgi:hypothetical protein